MQVRTSHRIVKHGHDKMVLSDCSTGEGVIEAVRGAENWVLSDKRQVPEHEKAPDRVVPVGDRRHPAVSEMIAFALEQVPHEGITVFEPYRRVSDTQILHLRDEP